MLRNLDGYNQWRITMKLDNMTGDSWATKSDAELKELIKEGVREVNKRSKTTTHVAERQFIKDIREMQGETSSGRISTKTDNLSRKELVYRARKIDRFLKIDVSSKRGLAQLSDVSEEARVTFNERYGTKLSKKEYREMVELMGAFKDGTASMDSAQIQTFFEYANDDISANDLASIFSDAEDFNGTASDKMEYIFDRIDELRELRGL